MITRLSLSGLEMIQVYSTANRIKRFKDNTIIGIEMNQCKHVVLQNLFVLFFISEIKTIYTTCTAVNASNLRPVRQLTTYWALFIYRSILKKTICYFKSTRPRGYPFPLMAYQPSHGDSDPGPHRTEVTHSTNLNQQLIAPSKQSLAKLWLSPAIATALVIASRKQSHSIERSWPSCLIGDGLQASGWRSRVMILSLKNYHHVTASATGLNHILYHETIKTFTPFRC